MDPFGKCNYCQLPKYVTHRCGRLICHDCNKTILEFECQVCNHKWLRDENKKWGFLPHVISGLNLCENCYGLSKSQRYSERYNKYFFTAFDLARELKNMREENRRLKLQSTISGGGYNPHIENLIYFYLI